jgi:hypothetical protein
VVLSLVPAPHYVLGAVTTGTVNIADVTAAAVSVSVVDASASEGGSDSASFRISRSGTTTSALSVSFVLGGSADAGDYAPVDAPLVIPAGSSSAMITIAPIADSLEESAESVVLTLQSGTGYLLGSPTSGSVEIYDTAPTAPPNAVTLTVTDASASESPGNAGAFLVSRSGPIDAPLLVRMTIGGTAINGEDYATVSDAVQIPAGAASIAITISPRADTLAEATENVTLTLALDAAYVVGSNASGTVTIANATAATVSLTINDSSASEVPGNGGLLSISRTGAKTAPLIVRIAVSGSATAGLDYVDLGQQVEIAAGSSSVSLAVTALGDSSVEGTETVVITLVADSGYALGATSSGTVNILDVALPTLTLTVNDSAASEGTGNGGLVTLSRSGARTTAMEVSFSLSGSATRGLDYDDPGSTAVIAVGSGSVTVALTPLPDDLVEGPETAVFALVAGAGYQIGTSNSGTVSIADKVPPQSGAKLK